ncbi:hypothetical protein [Methanolobus halotolerans]|uniref:Uncharacterized protein n=1 Tax=Methanolobus halotolerans TaxID=2052935 RepID=A0A4E0Q3E9_9EURY|nr:hypothetical protein [Methanolobus halotolerans]TGC08015.1 hypothetical protein CUN85_10255 [Methanolobus halotolerans]
MKIVLHRDFLNKEFIENKTSTVSRTSAVRACGLVLKRGRNEAGSVSVFSRDVVHPPFSPSPKKAYS